MSLGEPLTDEQKKVVEVFGEIRRKQFEAEDADRSLARQVAHRGPGRDDPGGGDPGLVVTESRPPSRPGCRRRWPGHGPGGCGPPAVIVDKPAKPVTQDFTEVAEAKPTSSFKLNLISSAAVVTVPCHCGAAGRTEPVTTESRRSYQPAVRRAGLERLVTVS